ERSGCFHQASIPIILIGDGLWITDAIRAGIADIQVVDDALDLGSFVVCIVELHVSRRQPIEDLELRNSISGIVAVLLLNGRVGCSFPVMNVVWSTRGVV